MQQASLEEFNTSSESTDESPVDTDTEPVVRDSEPEQKSNSDLPSCPWCLCSSSQFDFSGETVGCDNCDSVIPVDAEWYLNGEKVVV